MGKVGERIVVAADLAATVLKIADVTEHTEMARLKGADMAGATDPGTRVHRNDPPRVAPFHATPTHCRRPNPIPTR